jgi:hypothetical protein
MGSAWRGVGRESDIVEIKTDHRGIPDDPTKRVPALRGPFSFVGSSQKRESATQDED